MTVSESAADSSTLELPIFPLPNVVLFPKTLLPLHIFEPRYRQMVQESMRSGRRIGMLLLKDGHATAGPETSDCYIIGSMGRITECKRQDDGKFDILLSGETRFRVLQFTHVVPYRKARVHLLGERLPERLQLEELSARLVGAFSQLLRHRPSGFDPDLLQKLDFPTLLNSICSSIQVDDHVKQQLLEVDDLAVRAESVLAILERLQDQEQLIQGFQHLRPEDPRVN